MRIGSWLIIVRTCTGEVWVRSSIARPSASLSGK